MRIWLKKLRKTKNLTQSELANMCSVKRTTITEIENGNSNPSVETAKAIANVLGFDWTKFYEEERGEKSDYLRSGTSERPTR